MHTYLRHGHDSRLLEAQIFDQPLLALHGVVGGVAAVDEHLCTCNTQKEQALRKQTYLHIASQPSTCNDMRRQGLVR